MLSPIKSCHLVNDQNDHPHFRDLAAGPGYPFSEWPNPEVPTFGAGVYALVRRYIQENLSYRSPSSQCLCRLIPADLLAVYETVKAHAAIVFGFFDLASVSVV
jgi:hypothetical protein